MKHLFERMSALLIQRQNCMEKDNQEWLQRSTETLLRLVKEYMPSGAGFDSGTTIDLDKSNGEKLVFHTSFHHMNDGGYYDGWTEHTVTVKPSLFDKFTLSISGRDRNQIKDHIHDAFYWPLRYTEREPDVFRDDSFMVKTMG